MKTFKTFKTKRRYWLGLNQCLQFGAFNKNVKEIGKEFYNIILKKLKEEKTDGVIINGIAGTIINYTQFVPFLLSEMTKSERIRIEKILKK